MNSSSKDKNLELSSHFFGNLRRRLNELEHILQEIGPNNVRNNRRYQEVLKEIDRIQDTLVQAEAHIAALATIRLNYHRRIRGLPEQANEQAVKPAAEPQYPVENVAAEVEKDDSVPIAQNERIQEDNKNVSQVEEQHEEEKKTDDSWSD